MATDLPSLFFNSSFRKTAEVFTKLYLIEISQKSPRSYGFLITKELIFWLPNFELFSLCNLLKEAEK